MVFLSVQPSICDPKFHIDMNMNMDMDAIPSDNANSSENRQQTRMKSWLAEHPLRVFLWGLLLFALLDLGRSLYARYGYRQPAKAFSGAPFDQHYPWPPGSGSRADATEGELLYGKFCSSCHGLTGNGLGPAAGNLTPRPRDFRLATFKYQTTPKGSAPSDDDLERIIAKGLHASAMPGFSDLLTKQQIRLIAEQVKRFAAGKYQGERIPISVPQEPETSPQRLSDGHILYEKHCAPCHGKDGRGPGTQRTEHTWGPRDLTAPWTFRATESKQDLWLRIAQGIELGGMPATSGISDDERWKIAQFVWTLRRPGPWESGGELAGLGQQRDPLRRGEYLTRTLTCTYCHTESVVPMNYNPDRYLAGGSATRTYPDGTVVNPNITPDPETGIGTWTEQDIVRALKKGRTPTRSLDLSFKQWFFFQFDPQDAQAIARYLKQVPPKKQKTPPPLRYGFFETVAAKLLRLPLITPTELKIPVPTGPFVDPSPGLIPFDWPQQTLCFLQSITVFVVLGLLLSSAVLRKKMGRAIGSRRALRTVFSVAMGAVVLAAIYKHYVLIPRDAMSQFMLESLWRPPANEKTPSAMLERGRYLYSVSCMFCHQIDGGGGDRLSDPYAGGFSIRNVSSHKTLGIGDFTDEQIVRVIRSGIGRDGQPIFWGFMPWDMFSNFDEADLRALIAYVRTLPPVEKAALPRKLPTPDHPPEITWTIDMSRILSRIRALIPF
jgi:cytochrome c oxidase cbb3-type subunit 2